MCDHEAASAALPAAALEPAPFSSVELPVPPARWAEFVRPPTLTLPPGEVVPRALMTYDLPDLTRLIPLGNLALLGLILPP